MSTAFVAFRSDFLAFSAARRARLLRLRHEPGSQTLERKFAIKINEIEAFFSLENFCRIQFRRIFVILES